MNKKEYLSIKDKNIFRIRKVVEAELLLAQHEWNKDSKWYNYKKFDYDSFISGFTQGMAYMKRIRQGHNLEDEEGDSISKSLKQLRKLEKEDKINLKQFEEVGDEFEDDRR